MDIDNRLVIKWSDADFEASLMVVMGMLRGHLGTVILDAARILLATITPHSLLATSMLGCSVDMSLK